MKINGLSSNRRLKTEVEAGAKCRSGFIPSAASAIQWRLGGRNSACNAAGRGSGNNRASRRRRKSRAGGASTNKDVKNEATCGDVHENTGP